MDNLPRWVWDAVIALQEWHDVHPPLYMQTEPGGFIRAGSCACPILDLVPADVLTTARVLADDRRHAPNEGSNVPHGGL
jgi:hypothetical protein